MQCQPQPQQQEPQPQRNATQTSTNGGSVVRVAGATLTAAVRAVLTPTREARNEQRIVRILRTQFGQVKARRGRNTNTPYIQSFRLVTQGAVSTDNWTLQKKKNPIAQARRRLLPLIQYAFHLASKGRLFRTAAKLKWAKRADKNPSPNPKRFAAYADAGE